MSRITVNDAVAKSAKGEITVIDVREANELGLGHRGGALHIPLATLAMKARSEAPGF